MEEGLAESQIACKASTYRTLGDQYKGYTRKKILVILAVALAVVILGVIAMALGSADISPLEVLAVLFGKADQRTMQVVLNIRLPRVLAAIIAGIGLSVAGCIMQNVLSNPLASDYTLGISQGAAFGAAIAIVAMGAGSVRGTGAGAALTGNPYFVVGAAFVGALATTFGILILAKFRGITPESMVLAGIALGSLSMAGTIMVQYFANDVQVASIAFWTFGDIGRASWQEVAIIAAVTFPALVYFTMERWNYNALSSGDDVARSLGINVKRTRMAGMLIAALVTAVSVSFLGIIAFVGLVAPHMMRRIIGNDYRYLIPGSCAMGALLLLGSDTVSRTVVAPIVLPVGAVTSFMGAPLFIYLLVKGYGKR